MKPTLEFFAPNRVLSRTATKTLIAAQFCSLLVFWWFYPFMFFSKPQEILSAFSSLWNFDGLGVELITSLILNLQALFVGTLLSLGLAYLTVMPFFRPVVEMLSKLRFLSMAGLTFIFTMATANGHQLKVSLLVFSFSVFFLTGMASVVAEVPKENFDHARTLRMGEWRVVWEVIVLGQRDKAFEVLRQNAAICWMMLTMVEGMSRSEGGIGSLLLNQNKHFLLSSVYAIQICILCLGLLQDYGLGIFRSICCPYADLTLERK
jgi:NitT/TauT family transport system permease protein